MPNESGECRSRLSATRCIGLTTGSKPNRFWRALVQVDRVFKQFRSRFCGKCSPVHFFWGSFDHAVTRFSGRPAPPHPGGVPHLPDAITREAYSQEVSSLGFWPGNDAMPQPIFYSYAYPEPKSFRRHRFYRRARPTIASSRSLFFPTNGPDRSGSRCGPASIRPKHLRRGFHPGRLGPGRAGREETRLAFPRPSPVTFTPVTTDTFNGTTRPGAE